MLSSGEKPLLRDEGRRFTSLLRCLEAMSLYPKTPPEDQDWVAAEFGTDIL